MRVTVVSRDGGASRHLSAYARDLSNYRSMWRSIGSDLAKLQRAWWASKGQGSWPPRKRPGGNPLMVRSGKLMRHMTRQQSFLVQRTPQTAQAVIPSAVFYGRFHQTGTRYLPRRQVIAPLSAMRPVIARGARRHASYQRSRRGL